MSDFTARAPRSPRAVRQVRVEKGIEPKSSTRITFFGDIGTEELPKHRARAAASILSDRLRQILREDLGGTYGASASFSGRDPLQGFQTMTVAFGSAPENVDKMLKATLAEIEKLKVDGPTLADVQKNQEVERRELEVALERNPYWMASLQTIHMLGWDARRIAKRAERIELLTPENLRETFRASFPADRYTVVSLFPEKKSEVGAKK